VEHLIEDAGGTFLDASIIGGPPRDGYTPRIYVSGANAEKVRFMNDYGLNIIPVSDRVGDASALKMCYASLTKGSTALALTLMTAARALGVDHVLLEEFEKSQSSRLDGIKRGLPRVSVKARRFVGEMEEMDKTYTAVGIDPNMLKGAAEIYRIMGATHLADRVPEDDSPFPSLEETLDVMVKYLLSPSDSD
jgi:3-hydroxyisobutyrate dehydrogenase-like beta-hydroxyacid dehydrogenase